MSYTHQTLIIASKDAVLGPFIETEIESLSLSHNEILYEESIFRQLQPEVYRELFYKNSISFILNFFASRQMWLGVVGYCSYDDYLIEHPNFRLNMIDESSLVISFKLDSNEWIKSRLFYELSSYLRHVDMTLIEGPSYYFDDDQYCFGAKAANRKLIKDINLN